MRIHELRREQVLDGTPDELFAFFADAFNLEALTPPLLRFRVVTPAPIDMGVGAFIQYRLRLHGVPVGWKTLIQAWEPPHRFVDVQVSGPYALWHHTHELTPVGDAQTLMRDTVRYAVGFGAAGRDRQPAARAPRRRGDLRLQGAGDPRVARSWAMTPVPSRFIR